MTKITDILKKCLALIRILLPLARFDLFLQGSLFMLVFYDAHLNQLLRRSAVAHLLPNRINDWVYMGVGASEVLFGSLIGWLGTSKKNYSLSFWLAATGVCGYFILLVPQPNVNSPTFGLCSTENSNFKENNQWITEENYVSGIRTSLIIINLILNALAKLAVYALGVTYLDSHEPSHGPLYLGIQVTIRLSIGLSTENWMINPTLYGDYWYRPQISMASLIIMFAILFTLFPVNMPGYKVPVIPDEGMGFLETVTRVLTNKTVMIQIIALSFLNTALWGFADNEREIARSRFNVETAIGWGDGWTSRTAADLIRSFVVIYFMAIFRMRFSGRRMNGVKATTAAKVGAFMALIVTVLYIVLTFLRCSATPIVGLNDNVYTQPECSSTCRCLSETYGFAPICNIDDRQTYFSPCHAGCPSYEDFNGVLIFSNCTCGSPRVISSGCEVSDCNGMFAVYQLIYVNIIAITGGSLLMQYMVIMRSVEPHDQPTAIGTSFAIIALLAYIPGHYLYMYINESTCAWIENDICQLHADNFTPTLTGVTAGFMFISAILSIVSFIVRRKATITIL